MKLTVVVILAFVAGFNLWGGLETKNNIELAAALFFSLICIFFINKKEE